jgi:hypothetical protein
MRNGVASRRLKRVVFVAAVLALSVGALVGKLDERTQALTGRRHSSVSPGTDGRPDRRPDVRESASILGNLVNDFDFTQKPRPTLILDPHPRSQK